jgi:hypothetical protein
VSCKEKSTRTPGGLTVEASAECHRRCTVDHSGGDTHTVIATNRALLTWDITIKGECTTPDIEYLGLGALWPAQTFTVPGRPGKGGKMEVPRQHALVSLRPGAHQIISTQLQVAQTGRNPMVADLLWLQVSTT